MYTFDMNMAAECSKSIAVKINMIADLENRINSLKNKLGTFPASDEMTYAVVHLHQQVCEQKEKLRCIEYVLTSAASIYSDSDKVGLDLCIGNGTKSRNYMKSLVTFSECPTQKLSLPVSIEIQ